MGGEEPNKREQLIKHAMYALPIGLALVVAYVLTTYSPLEIGPAGILGVFVLLYGFFLSLFFLCIHLGTTLLARVGVRFSLPVRKAYYLATVVAFVPIFILALNSIEQLRILDVILILAFVLIAGFYVVRRTE
jgi:hypothetical protein